jgi:hypothetical protein
MHKKKLEALQPAHHIPLQDLLNKGLILGLWIVTKGTHDKIAGGRIFHVPPYLLTYAKYYTSTLLKYVLLK